MIVHLRIVGAVMALLVVMHAFVPGRLRWREELARLSTINRQIFKVHTMFIVLLLALFAVLFTAYAEALLEPGPLSRAVLTGLTVFWTLRLLTQWFVYSPEVWRGNRFNTVVHAVISMVWIYVAGVCAAALWTNINSVN
jgi:hypothetical protein